MLGPQKGGREATGLERARRSSPARAEPPGPGPFGKGQILQGILDLRLQV